MKKLLAWSPLFFNIAFLFLPLCKLFLWLLGYRLTLYCYPAVIVILTLLLCGATAALRICRVPLQDINLSFLTVLPVSFWIGWTFLIFVSNWTPALLCAAISAVCVFILFLTCHPSRLVKVILTILLVPLIVISFCFASLLAFVFADSAKTTIMQQLPSPDSAYVVEVLDIDEGALGTGMLVKVRQSKPYSVIIGSIEKTPILIDSFERTEYSSFHMEWLDDTTLLVNRTPYSIKD